MQNFFHEIVWSRFIRLPYGHVLDYAGKHGEAVYPSKEECDKAMPNPRSWGLPIENGGFFTGLYTYALLEAYRQEPSKKLKENIDTLIRGLYLLQDVAKVEGFIARGVGQDGVSHYPMGAECQTFPWILALYSYYRSDLCSDPVSVKARLLRVLSALKRYEWKIPCDEEGVFYKTGWLDAKDWRGVTMFVFCMRLLYELTQDQAALCAFEECIESTPPDCVFSRGEIVSQGYSPDMITAFGNQTWICTYAHLAMRELLTLDPKRAELYRRCLYNNGVIALKNASDIGKYDKKTGGFDINWRGLNERWEDYGKDSDKGTEISKRVFAYWHEKFVPHRRMEHAVLGNALFAAWVAVTCEDERIAKKAMGIMKKGAPGIDWDEVHLSYAFVAESALIFEKQIEKE